MCGRSVAHKRIGFRDDRRTTVIIATGRHRRRRKPFRLRALWVVEGRAAFSMPVAEGHHGWMDEDLRGDVRWSGR